MELRQIRYSVAKVLKIIDTTKFIPQIFHFTHKNLKIGEIYGAFFVLFFVK